MVKLTLEKVLEVMRDRRNFRNLSIIAHVDHGKSTLTDSLAEAAGLLSEQQVGEKRLTDTMKQEMERGVTIKSTSISLVHSDKDLFEGVEFLINIVDSPGHIDFSSEVSAALRVTDGAILVVDSVEGIRAQSYTVLKQALAERIQPVLMINKIDRLINEMEKEPEDMYQRFEQLISKTNEIIDTFKDDKFERIKENNFLDPVKGNVCFGAGKDGFGFTLQSFCRMFKKSNPKLKCEKFVKKLWGEYYWDDEKKKIVTIRQTKSGKKLDRTFVHFVLRPVYKIYKLCSELHNGSMEKLEKFLEKYQVPKLSKKDKTDRKKIKKLAIQRWLPAADALLEMIVTHLPSPVVAQKYRAELLYTGDINDKVGTAIRNCDPEGPLTFFISKNVEIGHFNISFGRVFSGSIRSSQKIFVIETNNVGKGEKKIRVLKGSISNCYIMLAKTVLTTPEAICGSIIGVTGLDKLVIKTATVSDEEKCLPIREMTFAVEPVVKIAISAKNPKNLKNLLKGIRRLVRGDPLLQSENNEKTKQTILAGSGPLHLETSIVTLKEYCSGIDIVTSDVIVSYKETVLDKGEVCLSKSKNKHNRVYIEAEQFDDELVMMIEKGDLDIRKTKEKKFYEEFYKSWDKKEVRKIWNFGPEPTNGNVLVNQTKGVPYINEVKESLKNGFIQAVKSGVLCGEEMRGVRLNIKDGKFHSDAPHRGGGSVVPMMRKAVIASCLSAGVRLVQPYYSCEVHTSQSTSGNCITVLKKRKSIIENIQQTFESVMIQAKIPVRSSFGVVEELRSVSSGEAFCTLLFSHWAVIEQDPFDESTEVHKLVMKIRKRKKMKNELPKLSDYNDRL